MDDMRDALDEVLAKNDIVDVIGSYTALKPRGSSYLGLCPFHRERTPSFSVSAEKQLYHCFGCGESGNVYGFIMKAENLNFMEAARFLANRVNYTLPEGKTLSGSAKKKALKEKLFEINKLAARFFFDCLNSEDGKAATAYLDKRKVSPNIRKRFGLGASSDKWDSLYKFLRLADYDDALIKTSGLVLFEKGICDKFRNRLMFPIFSAMGEITGFGGRILGDGNVKYLNSPETPVFEKSKNLYGINFARKSKKKEFILTEGYMDVIALNQAGFTNAVAALGTAFNQEHAKLLKRYADKAVLVFDSDSAGVAAALRAIPQLEENGMVCRVLTLNGAKDPDEFITLYGAGAFADALAGAAGSVIFKINTIKNKYDLEKTDGAAAFSTESAKLLATLPSAIERSAYAKEVSKLSGVRADAILDEANKLSGSAAQYPLPPDGVLPLSKRGEVRNRINTKGGAEAKKSILHIASSSRTISAALKKVLKPEHMLNETYAKLLAVLYAKIHEEPLLSPAELVNCFETYDEQKMVADVFNAWLPEAEVQEELETILTGLVREVIMDYYEHCSNVAGKSENVNALNEILLSKKNISEIYVNLSG